MLFSLFLLVEQELLVVLAVCVTTEKQVNKRVSRRLYKEAGYKTFEECAKEKWQLSRRSAYAYIDSVGVSENVQTTAQNKPSLSHTQVLAPLKPSQQREVVIGLGTRPTLHDRGPYYLLLLGGSDLRDNL
jgi:hypothetical protein